MWLISYHYVVDLTPLCGWFHTIMWLISYHYVVDFIPLCDWFHTIMWLIAHHYVVDFTLLCGWFHTIMWLFSHHYVVDFTALCGWCYVNSDVLFSEMKISWLVTVWTFHTFAAHITLLLPPCQLRQCGTVRSWTIQRLVVPLWNCLRLLVVELCGPPVSLVSW